MDTKETTNTETVEDLTVNEDVAADVKGGEAIPFYLKLHGVDGEATAGQIGGYDTRTNIKI